MGKFNFFLKKNNNNTPSYTEGEDPVVAIKNWYSDRYEHAVLQRNILLLVTVISICTILATMFIVKEILSTKSIEPFVLTIEDQTGVTTLVDPTSELTLTSNEALNRYFLFKYMIAREAYDPITFNADKNLVRLMSTQDVYSSFNSFLNRSPLSPITLYGTANHTTFKLKSIQFVDSSDNIIPKTVTAQVRFSVTENEREKKVYDKIATIVFAYVTMELSKEDRYINPLGFQIRNYRVDDELN